MGTVIGKPPNYLKIVAAFPKAIKKSTIFAYAPNIYVSDNKPISKALEVHEQVHLDRQQAYEGGAESWWNRYLIDPKFRFEEELLAHIAEYQFLMQNGSRKDRRVALHMIATRLSSNLYGFRISYDKACNALSKEKK